MPRSERKDCGVTWVFITGNPEMEFVWETTTVSLDSDEPLP